jgi:hypothetical protein
MAGRAACLEFPSIGRAVKRTAEQRTLHQVQRVHLEIPVVPVHRPLRGEQMQLVGQKAELAVLHPHRRELKFEAARVIAVVVVPLADGFAPRGIDRRIA